MCTYAIATARRTWTGTGCSASVPAASATWREKYKYPWIGARVHHIQSSDDDRALHNHPWGFLTLILRGSYVETQMAPWIVKTGRDSRGWSTETIGKTMVDVRRRTFSTGSLRYCRANTFHMLHLPPGGEAVTLFITFPKSQGWGFLFKRRTIPHDKFEHIGNGSGITVQTQPGGRLAAD